MYRAAWVSSIVIHLCREGLKDWELRKPGILKGSHGDGSSFPKVEGCLCDACFPPVNLHNHGQPFLVLPSTFVGLIFGWPQETLFLSAKINQDRTYGPNLFMIHDREKIIVIVRFPLSFAYPNSCLDCAHMWKLNSMHVDMLMYRKDMWICRHVGYPSAVYLAGCP